MGNSVADPQDAGSREPRGAGATTIDRRKRSRLRNYGEQISALGVGRWLRFKVRRLQSRFAAPGREFEVVTPLATHPLAFRAHTSDTYVFNQIFLHREYRCLDHVRDAGLVIDCGANVGYSSAYFLSRFPGADVIAIEPDSDNFEMLRTNLEPYGKRCTAIRAGVWSSDRGVVVTTATAGRNEEWAVKVRSPEAGETPTVPSVEIGALLRASGHDRISILKIDIEGSEKEVFAADVSPWLPVVDNLVIELHGPKCRQIFMDAIDGVGFEVSKCEELVVCTRVPAGASQP